MICSNVSDSISEARLHYHQAHIDHDLDMNDTCGSANNSDEPILFPEDDDYEEEDDEVEEDMSMPYGGHSSRTTGRVPFNVPSTSRPRGSVASTSSGHTKTGHHGVQRSTQPQPAHTASSATTHHHPNQRTPSAHFNHFNVDHTIINRGHSSTVDSKPTSLVTGLHQGSGSPGRRGKISGKPIPPEKANSIKIQTSGTNGTCTIKSGYITCPVCSCTKFYTTLQRRYGQFSCVGCYRFFKEFFVKPKRYGCPQLGQCPLDQRTKCKGCWMKKCIDVYTVDDTRRELLVAHRPVKKNVVKSPTRQLSSNGGGGLPGGAGDMVTHRIQVQSSPNGNGMNDSGNGRRQSPPVLETIVHDEDDQEISSRQSNNNNMSSSDQDDFQVPPPKLPKLTLHCSPRVEKQETEDQGADDGQDLDVDDEEHGTHTSGSQFRTDDGTDDQDQMAIMQESGHSLDLDQEDGNSLDDADELPLDEREMLEEGCSIDEGSSLLLPSGSGYDGYDGNRSPSKMALSRAAAIAAVSGGSGRSPPRRKTSGRIKNWCCLKCPNCLADDCGKCINCLDRPKFGGPFIRKQRCLYKKCLMKAKVGP